MYKKLKTKQKNKEKRRRRGKMARKKQIAEETGFPPH